MGGEELIDYAAGSRIEDLDLPIVIAIDGPVLSDSQPRKALQVSLQRLGVAEAMG